MLFIASSPVATKPKLLAIPSLAQLLVLVLYVLLSCNEAAVIKKRETIITTTTSAIINGKLQEAEIVPNILTVHNSTSIIAATKLQPTADSNFATETSKELSNNEIIISEAKKLSTAEYEIKANKNDTKLSANNEEEAAQINPITTAKLEQSLQGSKQIVENLENIKEKSSETPTVATELSSNDIKEEKISNSMDEKLVHSSKDKVDPSFYENYIENNLKGGDKTPGSSSKVVTEIRKETEKHLIPKDQNKQVENSIGSGKEHVKNELQIDNREKSFMSLQEVFETTFKPLINSSDKSLDAAMISQSKASDTSADVSGEFQMKSLNTSTSVAKDIEGLQVMQPNTTVPLKGSESKNKMKFFESYTKLESTEHRSPKIHDINKDQQTTLTTTTTPSLRSSDENKIVPLVKIKDISGAEGNKKESARTMSVEETTKIILRQDDHMQNSVTTSKPVLFSITQESLQGQVENIKEAILTPLNNKTKKPKFISDNSTNAQQLNLPNNAEVWSLAAMKSLPKANITMAMTQTHNQTNDQPKETIPHSEKNLLDWSQIMMDKDLSTTTRNENYKAVYETEAQIEKQNHLNSEDTKTENLDSIIGSTTLMPVIGVTEGSLREHDLITTTSSYVPIQTTILTNLNYDETNNHNTNDQPDKRVIENINNHIDIFTTTLKTNPAYNNPSNTTMNIELNTSGINLTSNQAQIDLNNDVHNVNTTSGKKIVNNDDEVYANDYIETSSVAATTTPPATVTAVVHQTTIEQISSETTTVSTVETSTRYTSSNNVVINEPKQNINKINNVVYEESNSSLPILHNGLENALFDKPNNQHEIIDLSTQTKTTIIPITTFRPTILAITSTTSAPATFEQEVDQKGNEIQTNLTNQTNLTEQQSIITTHSSKANETHLTEREPETTTIETITTTTTAAATAGAGDTTVEYALMSTTASYPKDGLTYETTEINLESSETTTATETTPKPVDENKNRGHTDSTTGSPSVSTDEKFEKESKKQTEIETNFSATTSTETPVVTDSEVGTALIGNRTPTTTAATETTTPTATATASATATVTTAATERSIIGSKTEKPENAIKENNLSKHDGKIATTIKTIMNSTQEILASTTSIPATTPKEEETYISLLEDTTTTSTTNTATTISTRNEFHTPSETMTTTTAATPSSTFSSAITTRVEEVYDVINSTTTDLIRTTTEKLLTEINEDESSANASSSTSTSTYFSEMLPPTTTTPSSRMTDISDIGKSLPTLTSIMGVNSGNMYPKNSEAGETDVNVIIAITVSIIGVVALILLVGFLFLMRKRQKQTSYSQRCRPVSLDEYTIDNASVGGSMRKSSALRASKRTYGNLAFDDPALRHNPLGVHDLMKFAQEKLRIFEEFRDVPQITSRLDEVPTGSEDKNRYANVLPLPETRVILQRLNDDEKTEYINANYVTGPKDSPNYYIACQAPLESTVEDFWRMIWEQQSRVIIQATDLIENGVEKCADYLPPSVTLDNHSSFGDFQITLQNREIKDKYAISTVLLKHVAENTTRELTHYWYKWPEVGVPAEEAPIIAMLLEARSSLISYAIEQANEDKEKSLKSAEEGTVAPAVPANNSNESGGANGSSSEINGNISMVHIKKAARNQGPLTIHCSPGTGRTGTIIACDIAMRHLETPKRTVDIPQIVYYVRRGRASAVLTKEQYEFIYKVASMYAAKITNPTIYN